MSTVYFSVKDFRFDMRNPSSAARAHAIAQHTAATASQRTPLYSALYWRSCKAIFDKSYPNPIDKSWAENYGYREFIVECESWYPTLTQSQLNKLWQLATRKVLSVIDYAYTLPNSCQWYNHPNAKG